MNLQEQVDFPDFLQETGPSNPEANMDSFCEGTKESLMDMLNLPDMLCQGFDHLSGLPLGDLDISNFPEKMEDLDDPILQEFIIDMKQVFLESPKRSHLRAGDMDDTSNLILEDFEVPKMETPCKDAFSTLKRLWPDQMNALNCPSVKEKSTKHSKLLASKQNNSAKKKISAKSLHASSSKGCLQKSEEESGDEVDIETVDDDELNGKSGAEILSQKLNDFANDCQAARVREVVYKKRPRKVPVFVNQTTPNIETNTLLIDNVSPSKQSENISTKSSLKREPNAVTNPVIDSRRESLLRILPKGARIKSKSKDPTLSPISVVEKIKQSHQPPRASILIPHQEIPCPKVKSSSKTSTAPTAVVSPMMAKSKPQLLEAPVYKLTKIDGPQSKTPLLKLIDPRANSSTNGPQVTVANSVPKISQPKNTEVNIKASNQSFPINSLFTPVASSSNAEHSTSTTIGSFNKLLENLKKVMPKVASLTQSRPLDEAQITVTLKPSRKAYGQLQTGCIAPMAKNIKRIEQPLMIIKSEPVDTYKIAPNANKPVPSSLMPSTPLVSKIGKNSGDHDYCTARVNIAKQAVACNTNSMVDPWVLNPGDCFEGVEEAQVKKEELDEDLSIIEEFVSCKTKVSPFALNKDVLAIPSNEHSIMSKMWKSDSTATNGKVRRDSAGSFSSSHLSKGHRSSCSPSTSSSAQSTYRPSSPRRRRNSRSPRRNRSRSRETRRNRRNTSSKTYRYRSDSSSRSRSPTIKRFSRSRSRSWNRSRSRSWRKSRSRSRSWSKGREYFNTSSRSEQKQQIVEERRVIFVGKIPDGTTKHDLRQRFYKFGDIQEVSVHFRDIGDNYGFVTFAYKSDAFDALEHGNDDPNLPKFDLCFGGRRSFCKQKYSDLDSQCETNYWQNNNQVDFDSLLRSARAKMDKKSC